ncbi:MAG TPA: MFS transporter, partial [Limnochordia bacterium]
LASATSMPLYGKLADLYGRKVVLQTSIGLFVGASLLCGMSANMVQLILFRTLQGLGAGAIIPVATTIIGDLYTLEERGKMQGVLSAVWGVAGLIGPAVGALIVERWHWGWVFFLNGPIGLVAIILLARFLREPLERRPRSIDWLGAAALAAGIALLLLALLFGGVRFAWISAPIILCALGGITALAAFLWHERRAVEPILPLDLFRDPLIGTACAASFLTGIVLIAAMSYLPMFIQGVLGLPPRWSGIGATLMSIAWPACATFGGTKMVSWGFRRLALIGGALQLVGALLLVSLAPGVGVWLPIAALVAMGGGFGFATGAYVVGVQTAVTWNRRGVATSTVSFLRFLGQTLGIAVLGAVLNARIAVRLGQSLGSRPLERVNELLDPSGRAALAAGSVEPLQEALAVGLHGAFWIVCAVALLTLILVARFFPARSEAEPSVHGAPAASPAPGSRGGG